MPIDKSLSQSELLAMQAEVAAALANLRAERIAALRAKVAELAADDGVSADAFIRAELIRKVSKGAARKPEAERPRRGVLPAKYRDPNNTTETWSGKGKPPKWYAQAVRDGFDPADMEVQAP